MSANEGPEKATCSIGVPNSMTPMEVRERFWLAGISALGLAVSSVLLQLPILLFGSAVVGAWVLGQQIRFARSVLRIRSQLNIEHSVAQTTSRIETESTYSVSISCRSAPVTNVEIKPNLPLAAEVTDVSPALSLGPDQNEAQTEVPLRWTAVGTFEISPPSVRVSDTIRMFSEEFTLGQEIAVEVEPNNIDSVYVGQGGERIARGLGEHPASTDDRGLTPEEIREYITGDAADRIDWKATARLNKPYVRTYEGETTLRQLLVLDHRSSMGTGESGATKLDYAREIAATVQTAAESVADPLMLVTIGDDGVTNHVTYTSADAGYKAIRADIDSLTPSGDEQPSVARRFAMEGEPSPTIATAQGDAQTIGTVLEAYQIAGYQGIDREDPLAGFVQTVLHGQDRPDRTTIVTDDTRRQEIQKAAQSLGQRSIETDVFFLPTPIYQTGEAIDLTKIYDEYRDFERFRRKLSEIPAVEAYEVAPPDRIGLLLSQARERQGEY